MFVSKLSFVKDNDLIFATAPPYSNFLLGYLLSVFYKKPLILDYRDLWIENNTYPLLFPGNIIGKAFERKWLKRADKIIFTTEKQRQRMIEEYPFIEKKSVVVYNGYDEEVFNRFNSQYPYAEGRKYMNIVYTGSLTPYRDPEPFFKALKKALEEKKKIRVEFIGYFDSKYSNLTDKYGLKDIVKVEKSKKQIEIAKILKEDTDVCLLIQSEKEGGKTAIPGKLFEYMAAFKPILAIDDKGAVTDFAKDIDGIYISDFNEEEIYKNIKILYENYKKPQYKEVFSRKEMARDIEKVIDDICYK